jgi:hypothetical protein
MDSRLAGRRSRLACPWRRDAVGVVVMASISLSFACTTQRFSSAAPTAGFWYQAGSVVLPADVTARLHGPLKDDEIESIKQLSRMEIDRAFSGLSIAVTTNPNAFWRVEVLQSLPVRMSQGLPNAGESVALGALGGWGAVGFDLVALKAINYAPTDAPRHRLIEGIGRGIGRVAVHEFVHQILGVAVAHNNSDVNSYEYGSPDRTSQYYGDLHWTTALPLLNKKFRQ